MREEKPNSASAAVAGGSAAEPYFAAGECKVYCPKTSKQLWAGTLMIGSGLVGLGALREIVNWYSGIGHAPDGVAYIAALACFLLPLGALSIANALRGFPRVTVTKAGVELDGGLGVRWANWTSLDRFAVETAFARRNRKWLLATAAIHGPGASRNVLRRKRFVIADAFATPIQVVVDEMNAARADALGKSETTIASGAKPIEYPVGLREFTRPWLTYALFVVFIAAFAVETVFAVTPRTALTPSIGTLLAMGGLSRVAVLSHGEWYRIFTAPFLHANLVHLIANCIALILGGPQLERLIGRVWFFALFFVAALGGSLMSLAVNPPNLVSVGASGALMGMFAALFASSFRLPGWTTARLTLQTRSMGVLIPSLLPMGSATSGLHIDYGAHLGGALSGLIVGVVMLKSWPEAQRLPQLKAVAAGLAVVGAILVLLSTGIAARSYSKYNVVPIPQAEMPKNDIERRARAADLAARYPTDPRSHFFLAEALVNGADKAGAEREFRTAIAIAHDHSPMFGALTELAAQGALAVLLVEEGRRDEAKDIARPVCAAPGRDSNLDRLLKFVSSQQLCD